MKFFLWGNKGEVGLDRLEVGLEVGLAALAQPTPIFMKEVGLCTWRSGVRKVLNHRVVEVGFSTGRSGRVSGSGRKPCQTPGLGV